MKKSKLLFFPMLLIPLVSGCVRFADDTDDAEKNINWDVDLSKPIKLKTIFPETGISGFGNDDSSKIIEDTTGYKVEYEQLSPANADNDVANIFLNQDKYHFIKLTEAQYHPNAQDGTLLDLTSLLEKTESGRLLYQLIDLMDYGWDAVTFTKPNGKKGIYAVPDFGYCCAEDTAFVWNTTHLKEVGYVDDQGNARTPETLTEFTDALQKCQDRYGTNTSYHALSVPGSNMSNNNAIMSAFEVPLEFYIDEKGKVQQYVYHDGVAKYVEYMHELRNRGILSANWQNSDNAPAINSFATETCSCVTIQYWWVESLVNGIVAKSQLAQRASVKNDYRTVHDNCITWHTRVKGDGSFDSVKQTKARIMGGDDGVSYYTAIPYYMADQAVYVIDYLAKKLLNFANYYGGSSLSKDEIKNGVRNDGTKIDDTWIKNNIHWYQTDTPEGAKDFYADGDYGYQQFENYGDKIIYLRPYNYCVKYEIDENLPHEVAVGETKSVTLNCETKEWKLEEVDGKKIMTLTVNGGGIWVQMTQRYLDFIVDNSQYCTGTNCVSANVLFHLRETGFDAWQVTVPMDETIITCPVSMMPPMSLWAPISILSRTVAKRGIAKAIDAAASTTPTQALNITRQSMLETYKKGTDGTKYFYWSDAISEQMTQWYNEVKLKR